MKFGVNLIQTRPHRNVLSRGEPTCDVASRHATSASPPYHRVHMPEQACDRWSEAGLREHYVPTGHDTSPALRSVPRGHSTLARSRAAFRHWPEPRRTSPTASAPMPTPLWTRSPGETAYTRCWTYNPPFFPSRVHVAAPVHHWRRRWASCSACAHDPLATPGPSLAPTWAPARAHSLAFARIVPEFEPRRPCGHCLAAGQHRSPLRPNLRRQSSSYVHLWSFVPFVGQVRPAIATGELSPRRRGMLAMI
jgi:hypothetical protein